MIQIRSIIEYADWMKLAGAWTEMLEVSACDNVFLTWEWLTTWWRWFGKDRQLFVLLAVKGGEIGGIAPLMLSRGGLLDWWRPVLRFIGTPFSDYADVIIPRDSVRGAEELSWWLTRNTWRWARVQLCEIPEGSPALRVLREVLDQTRLPADVGEANGCPYIPVVQPWTTYYTQLSGQFRKTLRGSETRLAQVGSLIFERHKELGEGQRQEIFQLHQRWQDRKIGRSVFASLVVRDFFAEIVHRFAERGWLDVSMLKLGRQLIAYRIGFLYKNKLYCWQTGFDPAYDAFSPGQILLKHLIEDAFRQGVAEIDLLRGVRPYKMRWTSHIRRNYEVTLFRDRVAHATVQGWKSIRASLKRIESRNRLLHAVWVRASKVLRPPVEG